jgi:hypothetical protein
MLRSGLHGTTHARSSMLMRAAAAARSTQRRFGVAAPATDIPTPQRRWLHVSPLAVSMMSGGALWALGDYIEQTSGHEEPSSAPAATSSTTAAVDESHHNSGGLNKRRLAATACFGLCFTGFVGYKWYGMLERLATHHLKLVPGGAKSIATKLTLEFAVWHPMSLVVFWLFVGTAEGNSLPKVWKQLRNDFGPTLMAEYAIWAPMDTLNFWLVPVRYQVLLNNFGSLIEALVLSHIREHGFPAIAWPGTPTVATRVVETTQLHRFAATCTCAA